MTFRTKHVLMLLLCVGWLATTTFAQFIEVDPIIDSPMDEDPVIPKQPTRDVFAPELAAAWVKAMDRPDVLTRREAVTAFGKASLEGMPDIPASVNEKMIKWASDPETHSALRLASLKALIQMQDKSAIDAIRKANEEADVPTVLLTDPILVEWDDKAIRETWLKRAADESTVWAIRRSAIESLGDVKETKASAGLVKLVMDVRRPAALRLVAARAVGKMTAKGLVADANMLTSGNNVSMVDKLCAIELLSTHTDSESKQTLTKLAGDDESAVVAEALGRLVANHVKSLNNSVGSFAKSPDANVRRHAARAMSILRDKQMAALLGERLGDRNPGIRKFARDTLLDFAKDAPLKAAVIKAATDATNRADWRSQEQGAIVLGKLDHEPAADRLLEIVKESPRHETRLAAIVAIRWLAVDAMLPKMLEHFKAIPTQVNATMDSMVQHGIEQSHMVMYFGVAKYAPAESELLKMVPKAAPYNANARAAAVWTLGHLHAGNADAGLAKQLAGRLGDTNPMNPEAGNVRMQSAIAIGRMKAKNGVGALRRFNDLEMEGPDIVYACRWGLAQIQGGEPEPLPVAEHNTSGWFIEPILR